MYDVIFLFIQYHKKCMNYSKRGQKDFTIEIFHNKIGIQNTEENIYIDSFNSMYFS